MRIVDSGSWDPFTDPADPPPTNEVIKREELESVEKKDDEGEKDKK